MWYIVAEVLKFIGAAVTASAAVAGAYLDGTRSIESGKLTRRGYIVVGAALVGILLSGSVQVFQWINSEASADAARKRNEETAARLERISTLILRQSYPLEPVELFFALEYPMDQLELKAYSERVQRDIVAYLREQRGDRRETSDDLADEEISFVISNVDEWKPRDTEGERRAIQLLEDHTTFVFTEQGVTDPQALELMSTSPSIQEAIVTMPSRNPVEQRIELVADYKRRIFFKSVRCRYPVRKGTDVAIFSVLDLVGRVMTWREGVVSDLQWTVASFGMRFSYDYGFGQNYDQLPAGRKIDVGSSTSVVIRPDHTGLGLVLGRT